VIALQKQVEPVPEEVLVALKAAYRAEVEFMDHQLGSLFDSLHRYGLYDRSLIIVVSGHGEFLGERGFFGHNYRLDPELMEIPLIIKWPGQQHPRREEVLASQVDLLPTILQSVGIDVSSGDGIALQNDNRDQLSARSFVLMEEHQHALIHDLSPSPKKIADHLYSLVRAERRFTVWRGGLQQYRRQDSQWTPVTETGGWEEKWQMVRAQLPLESIEKQEPLEGLDETERKQLQALGYLE